MTPELFQRISGGYKQVPPNWMSATAALRAFAYNDPFLIWARYHGAQHHLEPDDTEGSMFGFITSMGHVFEKAWFDHEAPDAETCLTDDKDVVKVAGLMRTIELMERRVPVVKHAALWSAEHQIYGSADVIFLASWFKQKYEHLASAFGGETDDYYLVGDVKFTRSLYQKPKDAKIYADQVRIYSLILGEMQQRMAKTGYLITRDSIDSPLEVPIGYELGDDLSADIRAIRDKFVDIKINGAGYIPWRDIIVAPNFANDHDEPYKSAKKKIAIEHLKYRPLEWLPGIGTLAAKSLRDEGYSSIEDLLAADVDNIPLGEIKHIGPIKGEYVRAVLRANKLGKAPFIPKDILPGSSNLYYCDFEFLNDLKIDVTTNWPALKGVAMIFMIGLGWEQDGEFRYKQFTAREATMAGERVMLEEFLAFLRSEGVLDPAKDARLVHFTAAEILQSANAAKRHELSELACLPWLDLQKPIKAVPIGLPGCWDFSLKGIVKALAEYAPDYAVEWPEGLANGANAQILGFEMYDQSSPVESEHCALISKYLEIDCKSMWRLLQWMRNLAKPQAVVSRSFEDSGYSAFTDATGNHRKSYFTGWYTCSKDVNAI